MMLRHWVLCILLGSTIVRGENIPLAAHLISYRPILSGTADFSLRDQLTSTLHLFKNQSTPPPTISVLRTWAVEDMKAALKLLALAGYYDAEVNYNIDFTTDPLTVNVMIKPGQLYTIGSFTLEGHPADNVLLSSFGIDPSRLGVTIGAPAVMANVRKAIETLFIALGNHGYPYATLAHEEAIVDRTTRTLAVTLVVNAGHSMTFAEPHYILGPHMDNKFIAKRLQWKKGETYSNMKVMQTIEAINNTGLYSYVKITRPPIPPSDGQLIVTIEAESAHQKPIAYQATYNGNLGIGGEIAWNGHSILQEGDAVQLAASITESHKALKFDHLLSDVLWADSFLKSSVRIYEDKMPAYKSAGILLRSVFSTPLVSTLKGYVGAELNYRRIKLAAPDDGVASIQSPATVTLPMGIEYESFDDTQVKRKGWDLHLDLLPAWWIQTNQYFFQAILAQRLLVPITADKRLVWSAWYQVGVSPGASPGTLPRDTLFFAGGLGGLRTNLGRVRGYGAQFAGDLTQNGTPQGGLALLTLGTEFTYHINSDLAIRGFYDMGRTFSAQYPNLGHRLFMGAGGGVTYATPIGALMMDVGFPVNRREEDPRAQVYITLSNEI